MTKIYVVIASGGEYEDKWQKNKAAWPTLEKANRHAQELTEKHAKTVAAHEILRDWLKQYRLDHPNNHVWKVHEYPHWSPGLRPNEITQGMRDERNRIQRLNDANRRLHFESFEKWNVEHLPAVNAKRVELGLDPKDLMWEAEKCHGLDDVTYEVEELELHD